MNPKVLFVDDDLNILAGFQRQLRKTFAVETAAGGEAGLEAMNSRGPFSVIVSDLRMPGMDGIQFLSRAKEASPDSVRIMLTGYADLQTAMEAVNEGNIFRFLTKPCEPAVLTSAIASGIRQYELINAERELLEKTLRGSIKVLSEILQLVNPEAFGRASRIAHFAKEVGLRMGISDLWQLETAAALSQIGCVVLPEAALKKLYRGQPFTPEEQQLYDMHPFIAADLIAQIPRMREVSEIISLQEKYFDGSGVPRESVQGEDIPISARILKVVLDFDVFQAGGGSQRDALERLEAGKKRYDPAVLSALQAVVGFEAGYEDREVRLDHLADGMILAEDITIRDGRLLVARGYKVNRTLRERLKNFAMKSLIREPIRVLVPLRGNNLFSEET